jgi:drug/metabolite transporter (DMT)-like permease
VAALLALASSLLWGVADFLGGTASRRLSPYAVIGVSQGIALLGLVGYAAAAGRFADDPAYLPWAIAAGLTGLVALSAFYTALATGTMGVVAPIAATGVVVPVLVGVARGDSPSALQWAGAAVTIVGVVFASGPEMRRGTGTARRPIVLAFVAAIGFGGVLVFVAEGSTTSVPMTLLAMRVITVVIFSVLALAMRSVGGARPRDLPVLAIVGAFDVTANATYAVATQHGLVSLTAVLASLYPAVTVVLARRLHRERMRRIQDIGVATTLLGVVFIASGGGAG